jgi:hypothetical protein
MSAFTCEIVLLSAARPTEIELHGRIGISDEQADSAASEQIFRSRRSGRPSG